MVSGFRFQAPGSGFRVSGFGFRVLGSGFRFRVSDLGQRRYPAFAFCFLPTAFCRLLPSASCLLPSAAATCSLLFPVQLPQVSKAVDAGIVAITPAKVDCITSDEAQVIDDELFSH